MAQGAEATQSLEASASTHTLTVEGRNVGAQAVEVIASYVTSKKPASLAAARRTGLNAADTPASLNSATWNAHASLLDVGNSIHVLTQLRFSVASASAVVQYALYDGQATPVLLGLSREYTYQADASWTTAATGQMYPSASEIIDIGAASKVVAILKTISSGNVDIYIEAL